MQIELIDRMPGTGSCDDAVVEAARVSYNSGGKNTSSTEQLIRYMMRNRHTSPFEMVVFKFRASMPIFVARQWVRHRTASINEVSGRYTELPENLFEIRDARKRNTLNKQCSDVIEEPTAEQEDILRRINDQCEKMYDLYREALNKGIAPEQARMGLPLNIYTTMIWKMDLHNLFHFLKLRLDSHAQLEIRTMAQMILDLITPHAPLSVQAWRDYVLNAVTFSKPELDAMAAGKLLISSSKSEMEEFRKKINFSLTPLSS